MRNFQRSLICVLIGVTILVMLPLCALAQNPVPPVPNPCTPRFTAGGVIQQPPALFSEEGALNVRFSYQQTTDAAGRLLHCFMTPDGLQNPTLHVNPGDTLNITVTNNTPPSELGEMFNAPNCGDTQVGFVPQPFPNPPIGTSMNIHYHGTNTTPQCHGDNVVKTVINSGTTFQYNVLFPTDEPPGLYWYHPHIHGLAERDVLGGATGALVVDGIENVQPAVAGLRQRILVVRDQPTLQPIGETTPPVDSPSAFPQHDISVNFIPLDTTQVCTPPNSTNCVTNYTSPVIHMEQGERQFWRIANTQSDGILDIQYIFDGVPQTFQIVGIDAVPVNSQEGPQPPATIPVMHYRIPPAARVEIIVNAPSPSVNLAQLRTQFINTGPAGDEDPNRPLATVVLTRDETRVAPGAGQTASDDRVPPFRRLNTSQQKFGGLSSVAVSATHHLNFQEASDGSAFFMNIDSQPFPVNTTFDTNHPPGVMIQQGTAQLWILQNQAMENHEFHQHQIHFQVKAQDNFAVNGTQPQSAIQNQFLDMIEVPFWDGIDAFPDVQMLMDFRGMDVGSFVFHCHILGHEDLGMMNIEQVNPN